MTPAERSHRARIAGLTSALNDPFSVRAQRSRDAFDASFRRQAEAKWPDAAPPELDRKAAILRKLHYARMGAAGRAAQARQQAARRAALLEKAARIRAKLAESK